MYNLRSANPNDLPFIMSSFLRRYRAAVHPRLVSDKVYFEFQHAVITRILQTEGLKAVVACDPEDPNIIYGWLLAEELSPDWVMGHFIYVKEKFRKFGIANAMITKAISTYNTVHYSHKTNCIQWLDKKHIGVFCPAYVWSMVK